jgi:Xaa-Pro aminopeptidase
VSPLASLPAPPWAADDAFPRYGDAEYEARWRAFRSLLRNAGATIGIIAGHGAGRAEIQFLTNAPVRWESLLLFPADEDEEPRLLVQLDNHAAGLLGWSMVPVEACGPGLADRAADLVTAHAGPDATVALLGPFSERLGRALRARLADVPILSISDAFRLSRMTKSDEELRWTRYGAALCDHAVGVFLEGARPGLREDELGAILTNAVADAGGQVTICFLATASMTHGGAATPNQTWSRRATGPGDLAMFELSAGVGAATGQVLRTVSLGDEPTAVVRRLHEVADESFARLFAALRPGTPVAELEEIGRSIEEAGFTILDDLVHGYGGGYLPPHIRTPATRREDPGDAVLEPGMLLVIQPNVTTEDRRFGVQTGELVLVTEDGADSMHSARRGLLRLAPPKEARP